MFVYAGFEEHSDSSSTQSGHLRYLRCNQKSYACIISSSYHSPSIMGCYKTTQHTRTFLPATPATIPWSVAILFQAQRRSISITELSHDFWHFRVQFINNINNEKEQTTSDWQNCTRDVSHDFGTSIVYFTNHINDEKDPSEIHLIGRIILVWLYYSLSGSFVLNMIIINNLIITSINGVAITHPHFKSKK